MIAAGEQALLREYLAVCDRLHSGFEETASTISRLMPMDAERIDNLETAEGTQILAYLKRFEQFEDTLHRTLKLISRVMEFGKLERLTAVDVTRRAHALGILDSEEVWADAVRTRNTLAHEYPLNPGKRAEQLNAAWQSRATLNTTLNAIHRFVEIEGLLS